MVGADAEDRVQRGGAGAVRVGRVHRRRGAAQERRRRRRRLPAAAGAAAADPRLRPAGRQLRHPSHHLRVRHEHQRGESVRQEQAAKAARLLPRGRLEPVEEEVDRGPGPQERGKWSQ